ncbi:cilia- and flagella-associated protein 410-like [Mytilus californianus]|uniref:cilia- and flagella-associated protein 410-like n=1 Tax=Mytilus californianus TaxID=6549 RepID=UPI002245AA75|nr:cilia- and flagella-associated protein 410-like [Mytilus californianus]
MECEYTKDRLSEALVLARTRATDFESVKKLNFWGSGIRDVSVVKKLPNLEVCSLSVNNISTLEDFAECENLREIFIRKNKIEDLSEICHLKTLPNLRNLWLADNPCDQTKNYRQTVLKTLPNLQKLDNIAVSEDELAQAQEDGIDLSLDGVQDEEVNNEITDETQQEINNDEEENKIDETESEIDTKSSKNETPIANGATKKDINKKKEQKTKEKPLEDSMLDPVTLSWEETNKIREELGLKPLPLEKITSPRPVRSTKEKSRNAHVLQAVLLLLRELDKDHLAIVQSTIQRMMSSDS